MINRLIYHYLFDFITHYIHFYFNMTDLGQGTFSNNTRVGIRAPLAVRQPS